MDLYSTHSDVAKTDLVDDNNAIAYRVTTEPHFTQRKTTISRSEPQNNDQSYKVVAEIAWHNLDDDEITLHGERHKARTFLPNHGFTAARREFKGTSGRAYYWTENTLHTSDGAEAARWHNKSHGFFTGHAHRAYLHIVNPEISEDLDVIILTLVYHLSQSDEEVASSALIVPFTQMDDAAPN